MKKEDLLKKAQKIPSDRIKDIPKDEKKQTVDYAEAMRNDNKVAFQIGLLDRLDVLIDVLTDIRNNMNAGLDL